MPSAVFRHGDPRMVDYTPSGADIAAGDVVVVGDLPLIAHLDIEDGVLGALAAGGGVYDIEKIAATVINAGAKVYWDDTNDEATPTASTHKILGYAAPGGAASADTTVRVIHKPGG